MQLDQSNESSQGYRAMQNTRSCGQLLRKHNFEMSHPAGEDDSDIEQPRSESRSPKTNIVNGN